MPKPGDYYMAQVMREIDPDVQLIYSLQFLVGTFKLLKSVRIVWHFSLECFPSFARTYQPNRPVSM